MRRHAYRRQPSGDEVHVAVQVVGRAQVDETTLHGRFAEQHRRDRLLAHRLLDPRRRDPVQLRERVDAATPDHLERPLGRRELPQGELERAILHHEPSRDDGREDGAAGDDADGDEREPLASGLETRPGEPEREPDSPQHQYRESTGV